MTGVNNFIEGEFVIHMKLYIGADHRGFVLKEQLKTWLVSEGYDVTDCGALSLDPEDDFPDMSFAVADSVAKTLDSLGIVICGSAGGVTIAANKVKGIRAVAALAVADVIHNRKHDDANVLAIASDFAEVSDAKAWVHAFLTTPYTAEPRFQRRLDKIAARER